MPNTSTLQPLEGIESLLTLEQVASQLGVHVKTVRRQVREGRLKAVRIGRQYRVMPRELAALTGAQPAVAALPAVRHRHVEAFTIVQIDAIAPEEALRIANGVGGAVKGRDRRTDTPLRVDTVYDESRARLKIIVTGSLGTSTALLQMISAYTG
jgi:excisionase family DNA binding protein